jgi:hypothetical protein
MANERYMEVLLTVLGKKTDVTAITKQDIKQVMEVVESLLSALFSLTAQ